jgi:polyhydroxybutyrate depolymerase
LVERVISGFTTDHSQKMLAESRPWKASSLAFRLGAELGDVVAAIAPVAGHCWIDPPRFTGLPPLLHIAGGADPLNPLEGGEVETPWGYGEYHPPAVAEARSLP